MLSLSDSVTRWFPGFGERVIVGTDRVIARRKVTVYDLLTHQSGVATDGPEYFKLFDAASAQEFSRGLGALPLRFHPGERWEYGCCGSAYEVLGAIVEQVSGTSLKEFLTTHIFLPLQMHDTYFSVPPEKRSRLAAQYRRDSTGALTPARQRGQEEPENSFYSGAGGLRSTVHDFHRFIQFLIGRGMLDGVRLLRAETVDRMITSQVAAGNSGGFGWGFGVAVGLEGQSSGPLSPGVFGWCGGTGTQFAADPRTGRIAIIIVPTSPGTPGVSALRNVFIQDALALPSSR